MSQKPIDTHSQKSQQSNSADNSDERKSIDTNVGSTADDESIKNQPITAYSPTKIQQQTKESDKFQPIKLMKQKLTFTAARARKKRSNLSN